MVIDMIPPEYWAQMRRELESLGDVCVTIAVQKVAMAKFKEAEARRIRINAEYDEAIKRKRQEARRESKRRSKEKNK